MQDSIFRLVSIGMATVNKERSSRRLNVLPVEMAGATDDEVTHNPQESVQTLTDSTGAEYQVKVTSTRDIDCEWLPNEDNRATPPDVRRGELVEVWRMGDTTQYYWRSMALRNNLRTLESVVYTWNASPTPGGGGIDFTNCYFLAVSAHDGHITLGTSKANKEPYKYTVQINTKDGSIHIGDDVGNLIELESKARRIEHRNSDGTYIKIEKQNIEQYADEYIQFKVKDTVMRLTPNSITRKTSNLDQLEVGGSNIKVTPNSITTQADITTLVSNSKHATKAPTIEEICDKWDIV